METPSKFFPRKLRDPEGLTLLGLGANAGLFGLKVGLGLALGSTALFADGIHTLSDLATDLLTLAGLRVARRPPDESHAYGHGKFETLAGAVVALALLGVGGFIVGEAVGVLRRGAGVRAGWAVAVVAALSVALKEGLYRLTMGLGRRLRSTALQANAWHHRSDALSSVPVLIGGLFAHFGLPQVDGVAALLVALLIGGAALGLLRRTAHELAEGAFPKTERERVIAAIEGVAGVQGWHKLRTRYAGQDAFVDVHIQVDPHLSVADSHAIASQVEEAVRRALGGRASVVVHVEPAADADERA
ncbi:MAG: cation diffusion facilitator family transporter [Candidatus Bipolaricaulota bacterium]|nr:cation diffusion facilitator family transporter [Candidatus Bipolaricaulota bacterium]